jgi:aspartate racemase
VKRLGLIGGISWISTIDYYRYINEGINQRLGGLEYAECLVYSLNFGDVQRAGWQDLDATYRIVADAAGRLMSAGAEALVLCANVVAERIQATVPLPLIHIADATAAEVVRSGLNRVALLGTQVTMEHPFYRDALTRAGVEAFVPPEQSTREFIQRTLRDELGRGVVRLETRAAYLEIIRQLIDDGAEGIILGCTEIPLLVSQEDVAVPVFDTTRIHADAAVRFALSEGDGAASARGAVLPA